MDKVIDITSASRGIPTPKFPVQRAKQDLDPDLFVKMVEGNSGHVRRREALRVQKEREQREHEHFMAIIRVMLVGVALGLCFAIGYLL